MVAVSPMPEDVNTMSDATTTVMPNLVLLGLNHKTAPVEIRERLAFSKTETVTILETLRKDPLLEEVLLFSTCNRVEVLLTSEDGPAAAETVKKNIADFKIVPLEQFDDAMYVHMGDEAVRHIFRVASSLDSMIVGEPQILGQIKEAFLTTASLKTSGVILNRLLHRTFCIAKRVRTETGIGDNAVSISYAAIELAKKIFGELEGKKVLLIGAGEMAELAVEHLIQNHVGDICVANRTFRRGVDLARRFNGTAIHFEEIAATLDEVDIIISSTGACNFVVSRAAVKNAMRSRRNRSIFFIDIAVPRDIDPAINRITNAYVYDIDDLKGVVEENMEERNREALKAERLIEEAVIHFREWYDNLKVVPTIVALKRKMEDIASREMKKTLGPMTSLSESDTNAIKRMTEAMISKIMHDPILFLKHKGQHVNESAYLNMTRNLFNLDHDL